MVSPTIIIAYYRRFGKFLCPSRTANSLKLFKECGGVSRILYVQAKLFIFSDVVVAKQMATHLVCPSEDGKFVTENPSSDTDDCYSVHISKYLSFV